jgi:hypothetical protein
MKQLANSKLVWTTSCGVALVLGLSAIYFGRSASQPANTAPELFAGVYFTDEQGIKGRPEVRLRWILRTGWLPSGGFNVYRKGPDGTTAKLNESPLGANPGQLAAGLDHPWTTAPASKLGTSRLKQPMGTSYVDALKIVRASADKLPAMIFGGEIKRLDSSFSAKAFLDLKNQKEHAFSAPDRGMVPRMRMQEPKTPNLDQYLKNLGQDEKPARQALSGKVVEDPAVFLRTQLLLGALLHPATIGKDLGLAWDDRRVEEGKKYEYMLKAIDAGKETTVAQRLLAVEKPPPLAPPANFLAFQHDADTVSLRWDRSPGNDGQDGGLVSYQLYRPEKPGLGQPPEKAVSRSPILIQDIPLNRVQGDATHMEPMVSFRDSGVGALAPGKVKYKLVAVDTFGRTSRPAVVEVELRDLLAPATVRRVAAARSRSGNKVLIAWMAADQQGVVYNLYRLDHEKPNEDGLKLTQTAGAALPALADFAALSAILKLKPSQPKTDKNPTWLSYIDDAPPDDHYYVYQISAQFKSHPQASPPQVSDVVAVPSLKAPAAPVVRGDFVPLDKMPKPKLAHLTSLAGMLNMPAIVPSDVGGMVRLHWQADPRAELYRIYRASGSGFVRAGKDLTANPKAPAIIVGDSSKLQFTQEIDEKSLTRDQYAFIGQIGETTAFDDYVTKSHGHVYWYRVVAVNRWGIPQPGDSHAKSSSPLKMIVPSTIPPTTPVLVSAIPDYKGNIDLGIQAPSAFETLGAYHVYRREHVRRSRGAWSEFKQITVEKGQTQADRVVIVDSKVTSAMNYQYYVVADNGATPPLFSAKSNIVLASTFKSQVVAPTNVTAKVETDGVLIFWKGDAGMSYIVERAQGGPKGVFGQVSDLQQATTFLDKMPGPAGTIVYRVIAIDANGNVSNPNDYPLNDEKKDPSQYPAMASVTWKGR